VFTKATRSAIQKREKEVVYSSCPPLPSSSNIILNGLYHLVQAVRKATTLILAGASSIQIRTANLIDLKTGIKVIHRIRKYLIRNKIGRIQGLIDAFG
jgi:dihydroorotate dehydrogenase